MSVLVIILIVIGIVCTIGTIRLIFRSKNDKSNKLTTFLSLDILIDLIESIIDSYGD